MTPLARLDTARRDRTRLHRDPRACISTPATSTCSRAHGCHVVHCPASNMKLAQRHRAGRRAAARAASTSRSAPTARRRTTGSTCFGEMRLASAARQGRDRRRRRAARARRRCAMATLERRARARARRDASARSSPASRPTWSPSTCRRSTTLPVLRSGIASRPRRRARARDRRVGRRRARRRRPRSSTTHRRSRDRSRARARWQQRLAR